VRELRRELFNVKVNTWEERNLLGGSANAAASAKYGGFLGIETEFVDPFRLGPPIIIRPASLDNCGSHASIYLLKPFHRA